MWRKDPKRPPSILAHGLLSVQQRNIPIRVDCYQYVGHVSLEKEETALYSVNETERGWNVRTYVDFVFVVALPDILQ